MKTICCLALLAPLLSGTIGYASPRSCGSAHLPQAHDVNLTRLIRPAQFRGAAARGFVLVNPDSFRGKHGVSAVERQAIHLLVKNLKDFTEYETAEFLARFLLRTGSVVAEVSFTHNEIRFGQIYIFGRRLEQIFQVWSGTVWRIHEETGSMDQAQLALIKLVDAMVERPLVQIAQKAEVSKKDQLFAIAAQGRQIDPFSSEFPRYSELATEMLYRAIKPIAQPYPAARNIVLQLISSGEIRIRLSSVRNARGIPEIEDLFVGFWNLDSYASDLRKKIASEGVAPYLSKTTVERPDSRIHGGPSTKLISSIYERGRR